jgi:hypothetical protein
MTKLVKGQRAKSVEARAEAVRATVRARLELLEKAACSPSETPANGCFSSFDEFANWSEPTLGIFSLTPKTLRRHINDIFPGGQRAVLEKLSAARNMKQSGAGTPVGTVRSTADEQLVDHVHAFTQRYLDLLERLRRLSLSSEEARNSLAKHLRLFGPDVPALRRVK